MKFSITQGLNLEKLDQKIYGVTVQYDTNPYIFMNKTTLDTLMNDSLVNEVEVGSLGENILQKYYYNQTIFGRYHGCKVFVDNDLEYGEIELR